jgi:sec-independent protein translocase protein TatA
MVGPIGYGELIILAMVAVILFGKKLPEVARSVGAAYNQFRRGLSELKSNIDVGDLDLRDEPKIEYEKRYDEKLEPSGPKFEPPPVDEMAEN